MATRLGEPDGIIACDPRSWPTRGTHAVGVQRPWGSPRGQIDHCQVGGCMGDVWGQEPAWLACRVSLPEAWGRDEHRRQACPVPKAVREQTRPEPCVARRDAGGEQVPHGGVPGDDERGRHPRLRHALRARGERYVLGVPCPTTMRD
ncbi:MAG TPA: transposase [Candidatus Saccharimonadia bacterium]|nr:transposase [Candidatus Saccharimonadia bacterium]